MASCHVLVISYLRNSLGIVSRGQHASTCTLSLCMLVLAPFVFAHGESQLASLGMFSVIYLGLSFEVELMVQEKHSIAIICTPQSIRMYINCYSDFSH